MRVTIRRDLAGSDIEAALPPGYRSLIVPKMFHLGLAHVIVFPPERIITLRLAARAVERLGMVEAIPVIAFACDVTAEARECLLAADIQLLTQRDYGWTDTRYHAIHGGKPH
jgi:hypothetical protein